MEISSFFFHTFGREHFEIKTLQIRATLKNALPDIQILMIKGNMGILGLVNQRGKLIDNGLIIFYTDLIAGNFLRRQLLAPSNLGKIAFIKIRMNGIR